MRKMLVVDDDAAILEVLEMRLASMGFAVTATSDPDAAIGAAQDDRFDLALVDLRMEPMDGIRLMEQLHAHQPRLPVLIMTAHGTIETAVEAVQRGVSSRLYRRGRYAPTREVDVHHFHRLLAASMDAR